MIKTRHLQNIKINKQKNNKTKDAKIKKKNHKNTSKFYGANRLIYFNTCSSFGRNF